MGSSDPSDFVVVCIVVVDVIVFGAASPDDGAKRIVEAETWLRRWGRRRRRRRRMRRWRRTKLRWTITREDEEAKDQK